MLAAVHPKLPMRNKAVTQAYYVDQLKFSVIGAANYAEYLMVQKDSIELHFFLFPTLDPATNYGQVYIRTRNIDVYYQSLLKRNVAIHPNGALAIKPWGQKEFALLDPDNNLLTFGESV